jgi:hypothetical protein
LSRGCWSICTVRKHAKKDACHLPISRELINAGCSVLDLSAIGDGAPDALITRGSEYWLVEYKADYGTLTPAQIKWREKHFDMLGRLHTVKTLDQALGIVGLK